MPIRFEFSVFSYGQTVAKFTTSEHAQAFAQALSERDLIWTEVHYKSGDRRRRYGDGVVGQYQNGIPSPEFRGRGDEAAHGAIRGFFQEFSKVRRKSWQSLTTR